MPSYGAWLQSDDYDMTESSAGVLAIDYGVEVVENVVDDNDIAALVAAVGGALAYDNTVYVGTFTELVIGILVNPMVGELGAISGYRAWAVSGTGALGTHHELVTPDFGTPDIDWPDDAIDMEFHPDDEYQSLDLRCAYTTQEQSFDGSNVAGDAIGTSQFWIRLTAGAATDVDYIDGPEPYGTETSATMDLDSFGTSVGDSVTIETGFTVSPARADMDSGNSLTYQRLFVPHLHRTVRAPRHRFVFAESVLVSPDLVADLGRVGQQFE